MTTPSSLLLALAEHDLRMYAAYNRRTDQLVYSNPAFNSFFNAFGTSFTLKDIFAQVHQDDQPYLLENYAAMQSGILTDNLEFRIQQPGGDKHNLRLRMFFDDKENDGNIITGYLEDVSNYKVHNDTLNKFANKKNSILNILTHDLAGPLGSVGNLAKLLTRETSDLKNPEINKWISLLERISKNGVALIQDYMQQEFIESAGAALLKKRTDLVLIFGRTIQEYQQAQDNLNRNFSFVSNQPKIFAEIDESKFFQVVNNLISNAIKFTKNGGSISFSLEEKPETIMITLADDGIGIPEKFHAVLFDKFSAARRTGLNGEPSVGLGMSIIKTIVEWHRGRIWFDSKENAGTTFYIEIAKGS